jgi:hypothetical protein
MRGHPARTAPPIRDDGDASYLSPQHNLLKTASLSDPHDLWKRKAPSYSLLSLSWGEETSTET